MFSAHATEEGYGVVYAVVGADQFWDEVMTSAASADTNHVKIFTTTDDMPKCLAMVNHTKWECRDGIEGISELAEDTHV